MTTQTEPSPSEATEILAQLAEAGLAPGNAEEAPLTLPDMDRPAEIVQRPSQAEYSPDTISITGESGATDEFNLAMVASELDKAGWVYVYFNIQESPRYGDRSVVNRNMLPAQLKKRDPDTGRLAFNIRDPGVRPKVGAYKCWLHAEHEMRVITDTFGFAPCRKATMPSEYEAEQHTMHKHSREYAALEARRTRMEREEDRKLQRQLIEVTAGSLGVSLNQDAPVATASAPVAEPPAVEPQAEEFTDACGKCGEAFSAPTGGKLAARKSAHTRMKHPRQKNRRKKRR